MKTRLTPWLALALPLFPIAASAQIAVVATDNKLILVDGVNRVAAHPAPDTFALIDLGVFPPRKLAEIPGVPGSVIGPPLSVAVSPDQTLALDTACMQVDPADPAKQAFDHRMTVLELSGGQPRILATLNTGLGPAGVSINRAGNLALVANRGDGSVSVFRIAGHAVTPAGTLAVGNAASALGHVAFTPDGTAALLTRDGDNLVTVLKVEGERVSLAGRDIHAGIRPYGIDVARDGRWAVTAAVGAGSGDEDTISLIDLQAGVAAARTVDTVSVGQTPEGIKLSPDGTLCAVICVDGSNKPSSSPYFNDGGKLILFRLGAGKLRRLAEAKIGHWSQGVAFSADNRTLLVCNMVEKNLQVFSWDGTVLKDAGAPIGLGGGPVAVRVADQP